MRCTLARPPTCRPSSQPPGTLRSDLVLIDQVDDATVQEGDCTFFKRVDKLSVSQRAEVASVDTAAGTVTLTSPLHYTFKAAAPYSAQIAKTSAAVMRWAGIESLAIQGGTNPGYNGQMAGAIDVSNAAYCWVKGVQTDGTIGGMHVSLTSTYRTVVRDSHFHHSADYGFGHDCYGIVLRCGAADNLIENNIVRYMNKPILFNVSGGGNVIGYNYADNSWADPPARQEGDLEWFHGCRKRRKPGPEAAGEGENGRGDGGDCHGMGSTTKAVAGPAHKRGLST
jgi:hypothetical protein